MQGAGRSVVCTEAVYCNRVVGRRWGKGLQNTAEDTVGKKAAEHTVVRVALGISVAFEGTGMPEHTAAVVVVDRDKVPAGTGRGTKLDPLLGPWDLLMEYSTLIYSLAHRHLGRFQGRFGSLKMKI